MVNSSMDEKKTKLNLQTKQEENNNMKLILKSALFTINEVVDAQQDTDLDALPGTKFEAGIDKCLVETDQLTDPNTGELAPTLEVQQVISFIDQMRDMGFRPPKSGGGGSASKTDAQKQWHKEVLQVFAKFEDILEAEGKAPRCYLRDLGTVDVVTPSEDNSEEVTK